MPSPTQNSTELLIKINRNLSGNILLVDAIVDALIDSVRPHGYSYDSLLSDASTVLISFTKGDTCIS